MKNLLLIIIFVCCSCTAAYRGRPIFGTKHTDIWFDVRCPYVDNYSVPCGWTGIVEAVRVMTNGGFVTKVAYPPPQTGAPSNHAYVVTQTVTRTVSLECPKCGYVWDTQNAIEVTSPYPAIAVPP